MRLKKLLFIPLLALAVAACDRVPAGNVGIKVNLLGGEKGVDTEELGPGRYWIGVNEELYIFPTFTQNYVWTADYAEGSHNNESLSFQTVEGMTVNADVGVSYAIQPDKVSAIFQKYRRGVDEITDTFLRNMVRDALVIAVSNRPISSVYGAGKAEIIAEVEERVRQQVQSIGIDVERIYWVGELRLPEAVTTSLNAKIAATQRAQQRQNEVAEARAEAEKQIEQARGEAERIRLKAQAEAEANQIVAQSLSANLLQYEALKRWDGTLPRFTGSDSPVPFLNVDTN
ncbi:SPFH domain-containing protein [Epibacterium ulvae]|uniref:SPFH domain-containing protein n=1 Tax=Epibacterium ulvae TaxID=1156985 RepID=UPI002492211B|nr:SPFH domain-containing protein [Epibacterium ulvae]